VRRLRGCIDGLPRLQRATVVLRYGVGPVRARSEQQAARLLDLSRGRVRLLERRGMRNLARSGRGTSCEQSGISLTSLVAVYDLLTDSTADAQLPAPLAAGVRLANAAAVVLNEGEGVVAGVRDSGEERRHTSAGPEKEQREGPVSSAGPSLGDPFGSADPSLDNPMFLLLLAIVVACLVSAAREIRRAVR
jgi:Sigma-70, region 4